MLSAPVYSGELTDENKLFVQLFSNVYLFMFCETATLRDFGIYIHFYIKYYISHSPHSTNNVEVETDVCASI